MKKAKELSVVTYEMDLGEGNKLFQGSREHRGPHKHGNDSVSCTYQRFLFTGIKPSFSEIFVKPTEISPYHGRERC